MSDYTTGKIVMDATRKALHDAEIELALMLEVRRLNPDYVDEDGDTIDTLIFAQTQKVQELRADLHGNC